MLFTSPYYTLNKKALKHFDVKSKEAPLGNLLAAIFLMDQNSMPQPALMYKNKERVGLMIKAHLFFTDKGIFLTNDNLESDFFAYHSIEKIDIKKSFITTSMELHLHPQTISNQAFDMIDMPIKSKAADRIFNLKNELAKYVCINDLNKK